MNRSLSTKRLYSVGNYNNITFEDTIDGIPEELALDRNFINLVRFAQLVEMESAYRKYIKLVEQIQSLPIDQALADLEYNKVNTLQEIKTYLQQGE